MNWFLIGILAPILLAISTFIDKFLVEKYFKGGQGALVLYSCFIGLPVFIFIAWLKPTVFSITPLVALFIILNSFLYICYLFPYFYALRRADASSIIPIFQTIPIFTYFLALMFLQETLTIHQILASCLIILGSVGISLSWKKGIIILRKEVIFPMLFASLLISLNFTFFKVFALDTDFWTTSFWSYLGIFIFGLLLMAFGRSYRKDFINSIIQNKLKIVGLNALNEVINIIALIIGTFASLLAPLALISALEGLTPVFVFIFGIILSLLLPHIIKENIEKRTIALKIFFLILIFIGAYILNRAY